MRARFTVETELDDAQFVHLLDGLHLVPNIPDEELRNSITEPMLAILPTADNTQQFVRATFRALIHDYSHSVWGIVNEPSPKVFQVRLYHQDADLLVSTAHKHLNLLLQDPNTTIKVASDGDVKLFENSQSSEAISARFARQQSVGNILRGKRQVLWYIAVTLALGILMTALSHPYALPSLKDAAIGGDPISIQYWEQFAGRIATAFFVGSILAIYDVIFHVRSTRNEPSITIKRPRS